MELGTAAMIPTVARAYLVQTNKVRAPMCYSIFKHDKRRVNFESNRIQIILINKHR